MLANIRGQRVSRQVNSFGIASRIMEQAGTARQVMSAIFARLKAAPPQFAYALRFHRPPPLSFYFRK